jgi:hypothetical protein
MTGAVVRQPFGSASRDTSMSSYQRARLLLTLGAITCFVLFWLASAAMDVPAYEGFSVSLLTQPSPFLALLLVVVMTMLCVLVGTAIAGTIRFDAGLVTAAIGLTAISMRGGPIRYTLMGSTGPQVFLTLVAELMILYAVLGLAWGVLWLLKGRNMLLDDPLRDAASGGDESASQRLLALATQAVVTALVMVLLVQTGEKAQVLVSLGIASYLGTLVAHGLFPTRPSVWYWGGPFVVGAAGYLMAYVGSGNWMIGEVGGYAPALGRPLPLDYAGAGTTGAILAYWASRRWQRNRDADVAPAAQNA